MSYTIEDLLKNLGPKAPELLPSDINQRHFQQAMESHLIAAAEYSDGRLKFTELGAIYLLCGWGDGSLLSSLAVRRITAPDLGGLAVDMPRVGVSILSDNMLGRHAQDALALAAALGTNMGVAGLGDAFNGFDGWNRWVTFHAMGIALQQRPMEVPSVKRAERETRLRAEYEAHRKVQAGNATDEDFETFIKSLSRANNDD